MFQSRSTSVSNIMICLMISRESIDDFIPTKSKPVPPRVCRQQFISRQPIYLWATFLTSSFTPRAENNGFKRRYSTAGQLWLTWLPYPLVTEEPLKTITKDPRVNILLATLYFIMSQPCSGIFLLCKLTILKSIFRRKT